MSRFDVHLGVLDVTVDPTDGLVLLLDHVRQLLEDTAQLHDGALDVVHGLGTLRHVRIRLITQHHLLGLGLMGLMRGHAFQVDADVLFVQQCGGTLDRRQSLGEALSSRILMLQIFRSYL